MHSNTSLWAIWFPHQPCPQNKTTTPKRNDKYGTPQVEEQSQVATSTIGAVGLSPHFGVDLLVLGLRTTACNATYHMKPTIYSQSVH